MSTPPLRGWVFGALLAASLLWCAALVAAPRAVAAGGGRAPAAAAVPYLAGRIVCHQRPDRSYLIDGQPMPVCARCTGLYAGVPLGLLAAWGWPGRRRPRPGSGTRAGLLIAALPTLATLAVEWATGWSSALTRTGAGLILGAAVAHLAGVTLLPAGPVTREPSATLRGCARPIRASKGMDAGNHG